MELHEDIISVDLSESEDDVFNSSDDDTEYHISHPSEQSNWNDLSEDQRRQQLAEHRRVQKKAHNNSRRLAIRQQLAKEAVDLSLKPRTTTSVIDTPGLSVGLTFVTRQHFKLRVAEVCNLLHKIPRWTKSSRDEDHMQASNSSSYLCARSYSLNDPFVVKASWKKNAWTVTYVDLSQASRRASIDMNAKRKCPFTAQQLAPIVRHSVRLRPNLDAKLLREQLKDYVREEYLVDSIIQSTRERARQIEFGKPQDNIQHMDHLVRLANQAGHKSKIILMTRSEAKEQMIRYARSDHSSKMKTLPRADRVPFDTHQWQEDNLEKITEVLGCDLNAQYVRGVFFAPSTSVSTYRSALSLYSADAAHLSWGFCTLYSLYGRNSEMGAYCIAHAIISGNEDKYGWNSFFEFVVEHFPMLNSSTKTLISDRDKGLMSSLNTVLHATNGFFCSNHRRDNIRTVCGAEAANAYCAAISAQTLGELQTIKEERLAKLHSKARSYINAVPDELQYPLACLVSGGTLYGRSTNGLSEAMNSGNNSARVQGLDMFNAFARLINLERERFIKNVEYGRNRTHRLTEYARTKFLENSKLAENCSVETDNDKSGMILCESSGTSYDVKLPESRAGAGALFGACSCGRSEYEHFPCEHIICFANFKGYAEHEITPIEFHLRSYRQQYPSTSSFRGVSAVEAKSGSPNLSLRPAPDVPRKPGRPRKKRLLSRAERFAKRPRVYLCSSCRKSGHTSRNCPRSEEIDQENA